MTNGTGTLTATADYDVFGALRGGSGTGTFGYTGEQHDPETGYTYLRARYYDPALGLFTQADTVQPNAPGTQGFNLYTYVANNPTTWVDPSGHVAAAIPADVALGLLISACAATGSYEDLDELLRKAASEAPLERLGAKIALIFVAVSCAVQPNAFGRSWKRSPSSQVTGATVAVVREAVAAAGMLRTHRRQGSRARALTGSGGAGTC